MYQGPKLPTSVSQDSSGSFSFSNITGIETYGGVGMSGAINVTGARFHYISATGFNFNIPDNATITGVIVRINHHASQQDFINERYMYDDTVQLLKAGTGVGTNKAKQSIPSNVWSNGGYDTIEYGGETDLWGTSLTPADVNASNFGLKFSAIGVHETGGTTSADVDWVDISVFYTLPYSIEIGGVDRTADVLNNTLSIEDVLNEQVNTCGFTLIDISGNGIPETDDEIIITLGENIIFGGYVVSKSSSTKSTGAVSAQIHCVDYTRLLDRNLVHKTYEDMTDEEIIQDIVDTYCQGFGITTNNVSGGTTIDQISFNYIQPSQAIRKLAELTGHHWYIDYEKDIHFLSIDDDPAPFDISDSSTNYMNLRINQDSTQLKNRVYVRGGTKLSDATVYEVKGDGAVTKFVLPDKPHNVSVTVNGTPKTVGIKNVDTSGYDFYLNFQEKYLEQDSGGAVLTTSDTLSVTYQYDIPILVAQENPSSIASNGVKEYAIFDKSITTTQAARDRASAELTDYANDLIEGSFETYELGFFSGQTININLTDYNISDDYIIQKVTSRSLGSGLFVYTISVASSKTIGIIRFLINLLEANKNLIELDSDEVVDELFELSDSLLSDSLLDSLVIDSAGPYRTWASGGAPTPATRLRWDLGQWR